MRRLIMVAGKVLKAALSCRSFQVLNNVIRHSAAEQNSGVSTENVTQITKFEQGKTQELNTRKKHQIQAC